MRSKNDEVRREVATNRRSDVRRFRRTELRAGVAQFSVDNLKEIEHQ